MDRDCNRAANLPARLAGDSLCHFDVRDDNLLIRGDGTAVIVDWGMSRIGPAWLDRFMLALEDVATDAFDPLVTQLASDFGGDEDIFTVFLLGFAGSLAWHATRPAHPGLPTLPAFWQREARRLFAGARRRLS
ncbi:MAG: phosphotransferase [Mycobacteriales bacterium]